MEVRNTGGTPPSTPGKKPTDGGVQHGKRYAEMLSNAAQDEFSGGSGGGTPVTDRLIRGIKRTLSKTFLRPIRGFLIEFVGGMLMGGVPAMVFLGKHFLEGFLGVNSLLMPRIMKFTPKFHNENNEYNTLFSLMNGEKNAEYVKEHLKK